MTSDDIQTITQGFMKKIMWVVVTEPVGPEDEIQAMMADHLRHQVELENRGVLFAAGPLFDGDGPPVAGMFILRAEDEAAARAIADLDPMHRAGLRRYTLRRWMMNEGRITVTVNLSNSTPELP